MTGHCDWDREHGNVEFLAAPKQAAFRIRPCAPVRLERLAVEAVRARELVRQRSRGKGRQISNSCERLVVRASIGQRHLPTHRDPIDAQAILRDVELIDAVEELELHTAPPQHLVERCEHDVAHPGGHLPEDRALVLEEHLRRHEHRDARAHPVVGAVLVAVREHKVVQPADEREVGYLGRGTMADDPVDEVLVVHRAEPAGG